MYYLCQRAYDNYSKGCRAGAVILFSNKCKVAVPMKDIQKNPSCPGNYTKLPSTSSYWEKFPRFVIFILVASLS